MDIWAFSQWTVPRRNPLPGEMSLAVWVTNRVWLKITNSKKQIMCSCTISGWNYFQIGPDPSTAALQHEQDEPRAGKAAWRMAGAIPAWKAKIPWPLARTCTPSNSMTLCQPLPCHCWARAKDLLSSPTRSPLQSEHSSCLLQPCTHSLHALTLLPVAVNHVFWVSAPFSEPGLSVTIKDDTSCFTLYLCNTLCILRWGPDRSPPRALSSSPAEQMSLSVEGDKCYAVILACWFLPRGNQTWQETWEWLQSFR